MTQQDNSKGSQTERKNDLQDYFDIADEFDSEDDELEANLALSEDAEDGESIALTGTESSEKGQDSGQGSTEGNGTDSSGGLAQASDVAAEILPSVLFTDDDAEDVETGSAKPKEPETGEQTDGDPEIKYPESPTPVEKKAAVDAVPEKTEKTDGSEKSTERKTEKPVLEQVTDFDKTFPRRLAELDNRIKTAHARGSTSSEMIAGAQTSSFNVRVRAGRLDADLAAETNESRKEILQGESKILQALDRRCEEREKELLLAAPTEERDLKLFRAVFKISSGKDEHIAAGEKELAELIRENPRLGVDKQVRDLLLKGYSEMSAMRRARGLEPWEPKLTVETLMGPAPQRSETGKNPGELLAEASETFFEKGIETATPQFERAIGAQKELLGRTERERMQLFIDGIKMDAAIVQGIDRGRDVSTLAEARAEHTLKEEKAVTASVKADTVTTSFKINYLFARIASGGEERTKQATIELLEVLKDHPSIGLNQGFKDGLRNAFKANHENSRPQSKPESEGAKPATGDGQKSEEQKGEGSKPAVKYKELDLSKHYPVDEIENEPASRPYAADTATTIGLILLGLGLGASTLLKARRSYHNAHERASYNQASSHLASLEGLRSDARVEIEFKPEGRESARFSVEGRARDGRVVLSQPENQVVSEKDQPYRVVKPNEDFKPRELKYGDYSPVSVEGRVFYADKDGTAFERSGSLLTETARSRRIRLVPESKVSSELAKKIPPVEEMPTELIEHPEALLPENLRRQVEVAKGIKEALLDTGSGSASRLDTLERATKQLALLDSADQIQALKELRPELAKLGIDVKWETRDGATAPVLVLSSGDGSSRLVVDPKLGSSVESLKTDGSVKSTADDVVSASDELARLERVCSEGMRAKGVREEIISRDSALARDPFPSNRQVRTAFIEHLPETYSSKLPERLRPVSPEVGSKPEALSEKALLGEFERALVSGDVERLHVVLKEVNRNVSDAAARKVIEGKLREVVGGVDHPDALQVRLSLHSDGVRPDFLLEVRHPGRPGSTLLLSADSVPNIIAGGSYISPKTSPQSFEREYRAFMDTIGLDAETLRDASAAESLDTKGTTNLDKAKAVADRALDKGAESDPRFKDVPPSVVKNIRKLESLAQSEGTPAITAEEARKYLELLSEGTLEYLGPEKGKVVVDKLKDAFSKESSSGRPNEADFKSLSRKLSKYEGLVEQAAKYREGGLSPEAAWRRACVKTDFSMTSEQDVTNNEAAIDRYRSELGKKIPGPQVNEIFEIRERLGLESTSIADGYNILRSSRKLQRENPGATRAECVLAAETSHLLQKDGIGFGGDSSSVVTLAKEASALGQKLTASDLVTVAKLKRDFADVHTKLPKEKQVVNLKGLDSEAQAAEKIYEYVYAQAVDANATGSKWSEADQVKWLEIEYALSAEGPKAEAIRSLLSKQLEHHVFQHWLDNFDVKSIEPGNVGEVWNMLADTATGLSERLPAGSKDREKLIESWRGVIDKMYKDRSRLGFKADDINYNNAEFEFVRALTPSEMLHYGDIAIDGKHRPFLDHWLKNTLTEQRLSALHPEERKEMLLKTMELWGEINERERGWYGRELSYADLRPLLKTIHADTIREMTPDQRAVLNGLNLKMVDEVSLQEEIYRAALKEELTQHLMETEKLERAVAHSRAAAMIAESKDLPEGTEAKARQRAKTFEKEYRAEFEEAVQRREDAYRRQVEREELKPGQERGYRARVDKRMEDYKLSALDITEIEKLVGGKIKLGDETYESIETRALERTDELQRAAEAIVETTVGNHVSDEAATRLMERLSPADRLLLVENLRLRGEHLSIQGLNTQFERIAKVLRAEEFMQRHFVRGRPAEKVTVVCFGNATEGEALAYLFRKATGVQVEIINKPKELPPGKFLVLDKVPTDGKVAEQLSARVADGSALVPEKIQDFHRGLNLFDLSRAQLGAQEAQSVLTGKVIPDLNRMKEVSGQPGSTTLAGEVREVTVAEIANMRESIRSAISTEIDTMKAEASIYFAGQATSTLPDSLRRAETLASVFEHTSRHISYTEMMRDAQSLFKRVVPKETPVENCYFVVDVDPNGSGRLVTRLLREANGLTDSKYDAQFITLEEAKAKSQNGELAGKRLIAVNDCIYSGQTAVRELIELQEVAKLSPAEKAPNLVLGSLKAFDVGVQLAEKAVKVGGGPKVEILLGDEHKFTEHKRSIIDALISMPKARRLGETADVETFVPKLFSASEWKESSVQARLVFPHMVPNNNSERMNTFYRLHLGIAGAHSESRCDDPRFDRYGYSRVKGISRFGYAGENLLRGSRPRTAEAVAELKERGVTHVICLEPEMSKDLREMYEKNGITVVDQWQTKTGEPFKPGVNPKDLTAKHMEEVATKIMEITAKVPGQTSPKVFVHCAHGRDRTGAVVAAWEILNAEPGANIDLVARQARATMIEFGYTEKTSGVGHYPELIRELAKSAASLEHREVRTNLYSPEKESSEKLAGQYDTTRRELGVQGENNLRNTERFKQFLDKMEAAGSRWNTDFSESLSTTKEYMQSSQATYEVLLNNAAEEMAEIADITPEEARAQIEKKLEEAPFEKSPLHEAYRQQRQWTNEYNRQLKMLLPRINERLKEMQTAADAFAKEAGIPTVKLRFSAGVEGTKGSYLVGEGSIVLPMEALLQPESKSRLFESVYHEWVHNTQDAEIIRAVAQRVSTEQAAKGGSAEPADHKDIIRERYKELTGRELREPIKGGPQSGEVVPLLDRVLESMKGRPSLDADQLKRADALAAGFKKLNAASQRLLATEMDYLVTDHILSELETSPSARTVEKLAEGLLNLENSELRRQLFGTEEIGKLPPDVQEHLKRFQNRERDGQWRPFEARDAITKSLAGRMTEINKERRQLVSDYMSPITELEAQLVEAEMTEHRLGVLPGVPSESNGTRVDHSKPPAEKSVRTLKEAVASERLSRSLFETIEKKSGPAQDAIARAVEAGLGSSAVEQLTRLSSESISRLIDADGKVKNADYIKALQEGFLSPEMADRMLSTDYARAGGKTAAEQLLHRALESKDRPLSRENFRKFVEMEPRQLEKIMKSYGELPLENFERLFDVYPERGTAEFLEAAKNKACTPEILARVRALSPELQHSIATLLEYQQLGTQPEQIKSVLQELVTYEFDFKDPSKAVALQRMAACLENGAIRMGLPIEQVMSMPKEAREILNERMETALKDRQEAIKEAIERKTEPRPSKVSIEAEFGKLQACRALVDAQIMTWQEASKMVSMNEAVFSSFLDLVSSRSEKPISKKLAVALKEMMLESKISPENLRMYTELIEARKLSPEMIAGVIVDAPEGLDAFNRGLEGSLKSHREQLGQRASGTLSPLEAKNPGVSDLGRVELQVSEKGVIEHRSRMVGPKPRTEERLYEEEVKSLREAVELLKKESRHEEARRLERVLEGIERGDAKMHKGVLEAARRNRLGMEGLHVGGWLILASTALSLIVVANMGTPERRGGTATIGGR